MHTVWTEIPISWGHSLLLYLRMILLDAHKPQLASQLFNDDIARLHELVQYHYWRRIESIVDLHKIDLRSYLY